MLHYAETIFLQVDGPDFLYDKSIYFSVSNDSTYSIWITLENTLIDNGWINWCTDGNVEPVEKKLIYYVLV